MDRNLGDVRRSQVITNFGPGAIMDFRVLETPVSVIATGLEQWPGYNNFSQSMSRQTIYEPRLQNMLKVDCFYLPPVDSRPFYLKNEKGPKLTGVRFPRWLQCPRCHIIRKDEDWPTDEQHGWMRYCSSCTGQSVKKYVVPVRFMCACENGHIQDFPWQQWARHKPGCKRNADLLLQSDGKSSGLSGVKLECLECGEKVGMDAAFMEGAFRFSCLGLKPWLDERDEGCQARLRAVQRGASNLYFPVIRSAIDIPPWCEGFVREFGQTWSSFIEKESKEEIIKGLEFHNHLTARLGMSNDEIAKKILKLKNQLEEATQETILMEEYEQFINKNVSLDHVEDFETKEEIVPPEISPWIGRVIGVKRLREVRAIVGFTRIFPSGDEQAESDTRVASLFKNRPRWLPAIEVKGEGIFIELNKKKLEKWENNEDVKERARNLKQRYDEEIYQRSGGTIEQGQLHVTPRYILIHSLSHALIKQLAIKCGYSSASLRERIYCDQDMAGIMIYTASADSDGTLGGLVRQAYQQNFYALFMRAIKDMMWCSSDPVCINSTNTISDSLNNSACHSCLFLSETSCIQFNRFLDRAMLAGIPGIKESSFFTGLIEQD